MKTLGVILSLVGGFLTAFSGMSIAITWITFIGLAITQIIMLILGNGWLIGWWIIGAPLLTFFGGLAAMGLGLFLVAAGLAMIEG